MARKYPAWSLAHCAKVRAGVRPRPAQPAGRNRSATDIRVGLCDWST
nr:hypothetical protein [Kibdelosporangium sp. MJ126-NF4]CTQ89625.1 hypothetical protein [Kibdelosporangium sp. MJ126-NF4]